MGEVGDGGGVGWYRAAPESPPVVLSAAGDRRSDSQDGEE